MSQANHRRLMQGQRGTSAPGNVKTRSASVTFWFTRKTTKIVATRDTFQRLKIYLNAFAVGALPRTSLGSLQRSTESLTAWVWGRFAAGKKGRVENGRGYNDEKERVEGKERDELDCPLQQFLRGPMRSITDNWTRTAQVYTGLVIIMLYCYKR